MGGKLQDTDIRYIVPTVDITTIKMLLNTTIYTPGGRFMTMYIVETPFEDPKITNISASLCI